MESHGVLLRTAAEFPLFKIPQEPKTIYIYFKKPLPEQYTMKKECIFGLSFHEVAS